VIGLPGNPRSALVVFRLIGMPLSRLVGGCDTPPPEPSTRAVLSRDLASATSMILVPLLVERQFVLPADGP
jgi:molybdopterin molybdotransferase